MGVQPLRIGKLPEPCHKGIGNLSIAKYRFRLLVTREIVLPRYKGSALHGGFGHALKSIAPAWYPYFFEPRPSSRVPATAECAPNGDAFPKPFVLLPPLDDCSTYRRGQHLECELTLFGEAAQHIALCHAAVDFLGNRLGFGQNRGRFRVEGVAVACAGSGGTLNSSHIPDPVVTAAEIAEARTGLSQSEVTLHFPTRLRLKADNRLCSSAPPFKLFLGRLLGRLNTLAAFYGEGEILDRRERSELLRAAEKVAIRASNLKWQEWERFSGRQQDWMQFGGLVGSITYR